MDEPGFIFSRLTPVQAITMMAGMGDKLIHEYFGVDLEIIWEVIKKDLPPLKPLIAKAMNKLKK